MYTLLERLAGMLRKWTPPEPPSDADIDPFARTREPNRPIRPGNLSAIALSEPDQRIDESEAVPGIANAVNVRVAR